MIVLVIWMRVKLYFENEKAIKKSGIGKALEHQKKALELNHVEYTLDHFDNDYDILHVNTIYFLSYQQIRKAKKKNKKVVFHAHSTKEDFKNSFMFSNALAPIYHRWLVFMYKKADAIITPTPYSKSLLKSYGLKQSIYAISNGIETETFKKDVVKEAKFKEYFNFDNNQKVIISVGWLFERKGFDTFCEVATLLPEYTFIWFGDKNLSMPSKKIRDLIEQPPSNVILPGYIDGDIIIGAYTSADLFFFPSREETEGIVVLEALASNISVLVRDIPVYKDWLEDKINCYMGNDTEEFVKLIKQILNNELENLSSMGHQVAMERSLDSIGKKMIDVYSNTLRKKE